jgi:hypothetical protein
MAELSHCFGLGQRNHVNYGADEWLAVKMVAIVITSSRRCKILDVGEKVYIHHMIHHGTPAHNPPLHTAQRIRRWPFPLFYPSTTHHPATPPYNHYEAHRPSRTRSLAGRCRSSQPRCEPQHQPQPEYQAPDPEPLGNQEYPDRSDSLARSWRRRCPPSRAFWWRCKSLDFSRQPSLGVRPFVGSPLSLALPFKGQRSRS